MNIPSISPMSVLLIAGAAQGIFFSILLIRIKTRNRAANTLLSILLLFFSLGLVDGFLSVTGYYLRYPVLIALHWPLVAAYGPLTYLYVRYLTAPGQRMGLWRTAAHFTLLIAFAEYLGPIYLTSPEVKASRWLIQNPFRNYSGLLDPFVVVLIVQIAGYLVLSLRLLARYRRSLRENYSSVERINLSWLRNLLLFFLFLLGIFFLVVVVLPAYGIFLQGALIYNFVVVGIIYVMGYKGIVQTKIFTDAGPLPPVVLIQTDVGNEGPIEMPPQVEKAEDNGKYAKSSLSDQQASEILIKLNDLMEKEKPHLETGLTLPMLSKMLDVSSHHLSQVINGKLGRSFFDFINEHRVQEAKKALTSSDSGRFSILGIAMDAGFNSKNAFYSAFKKSTGMTPSQFRKQR